MKPESAIRIIKRLEPRIKKLGVTSLDLFGSTARGNATRASDVDVAIRYKPTPEFSLLTIVAIKRLLSRHLKSSVDVVCWNALKPAVKRAARHDAIRIF